MAKGQSAAHNLSGLTFCRLTVTSKSEKRGRNRMYWLCSCSCGSSKWVIADALKSGATRSCGCLNDEARRAAATHGETRDGQHSPEYTSWHSMKQRCTNPNNLRYADYGGRGIYICQQWLNSFEQFLQDMGRRPKGGSIDRIDNDGPYSPQNCRWSQNHTQSRNTSRNRMYIFNGEKMCIADWCKRTGIPHTTLHHRIKTWGIERAITTPLKR